MSPPFTARLKSRALVGVSGPDWRPFLQGLLTNSVEDIADGAAKFAGLLTPQGRLLFDLFVVGRGDGCLLDVEASLRAALIQRLAMYRLRAKVAIEPSDQPVYFSTDPEPAGEGWVADPRLASHGFRGYGDPARSFEDEQAYENHRLNAGLPGSADWGSDRTYPIEANFDLLNGIDFKKGCFVGQETTSRMHRRGQAKSRMLPIAFAGPPPAPGTEILAGELRAGEVRSGIPGRAIALLRLDRIEGVELTAAGTPVRAVYPDWFKP